jgi:hypothetical protein
MPALALRRAFDDLAHRLDGAHDPGWRPELLGPGDDRAQAEAFVAAVYRERHGATLREFMPWLLAFRDAGGALLAVVGLRLAASAPLFVEQYLDAPAEQAVAGALARAVERDAMVEVGGLAARRPGDARRLILCLTRGLDGAGLRWVLFAATLQLRNAFDRLGLRPVPIAPARRERLRPSATDWGRYYDSQPVLLCGDVAAGAAFLGGAQPAGRRAHAGVRAHAEPAESAS